MAQQINLCSATPQARRQAFSANTMAVALLVFLSIGGALSAGWIWSLKKASVGFSQTLADQERDIQALKTALAAARTSAAPLDAALQQQLSGKRTELAQREQLLATLREGVLVPGMGPSDRLALVARTIPADVWITELRADASRLELSGFTLEPSALNAWVQALSASPLMQGVPLASVQIDNVATPEARKPVLTRASGGAAAPAGTAPGNAAASAPKPGVPVWSFTLVSSQPLAAGKASAGAQP